MPPLFSAIVLIIFSSSQRQLVAASLSSFASSLSSLHSLQWLPSFAPGCFVLSIGHRRGHIITLRCTTILSTLPIVIISTLSSSPSLRQEFMAAFLASSCTLGLLMVSPPFVLLSDRVTLGFRALCLSLVGDAPATVSRLVLLKFNR